MKRRALLIASGAWLAAAAMRSFAQAPKSPRWISLVHLGTAAGFRREFEAFRSALKELGYVEGKDVSIDVRWAEGRTERLAALAAEAVALNPAVILTGTSAGVAACMKATSSIPIVFSTAGDPVEQGFVASLSRPGGNVTGITLHRGLSGKIVEIVRDALPAARRLAFLVHDKDPNHKRQLLSFEPSAQRLKFEPIVVGISSMNDLERAFSELAKRKADAMIVPNLALLDSAREQIAEPGLKARLPLFWRTSVCCRSRCIAGLRNRDRRKLAPRGDVGG